MSSRRGWTADQIPALHGRRAVVTGANSGLGFDTALELARHGAYVTMACRNEERGQAALDKIRNQLDETTGTAHLTIVDVADLDSVRRFAAGWEGPLDILVNNAGVMAVPYDTTPDGFERQLGTNHLGPFALTGLLLPALRAADAGRVVTVSSLAARSGRINFGDLQSTRKYAKWAAYGQSKLANLLFTRELALRLNRAGSTVTAAAAHPGLSDTELLTPFAGTSGPVAALSKRFITVLGQPASEGALPSLYAATMPDVVPADFFGPSGWGQRAGAPVRVDVPKQARDAAAAARLWAVSENLTGVSYELPA